jgi:hypothetical protein
MNPPDLQSLRAGQPEAWDAAFQWLWPVVFAVAINPIIRQTRL